MLNLLKWIVKEFDYSFEVCSKIEFLLDALKRFSDQFSIDFWLANMLLRR
jgi:hypothetical protein